MSLSWWFDRKKMNIIVDNDSWIIPHATNLVVELNAKGFDALFFSVADKQRQADIAFYLGCMKIVSIETLSLCHKNLVVHESELPKGKGFSPLTWQILEGKNQIPVCLLEMVDRVDSGLVVSKQYLNFTGVELIDEMRVALGQRTVEMCLDYVLSDQCPEGLPQIGEETFYPRRRPENSELNVETSIIDNFNLLRVVDNEKYPAFFFYKGRLYIISITNEII